MGRIIVNVMPTPDSVADESRRLSDALAEHGVGRVTSVLPGRRYNIYIDGEASEADLPRVREAAAATLVDPTIETITGVFIGSVHATEEDDWELFADGIGAIGPIPDGAGRHAARPVGPHDVDVDKLAGVGEHREFADDDSEDEPNSDPTKLL